MTTLGLNYLNLQEQKRSNLAREAETHRSNVFNEGVKAGELDTRKQDLELKEQEFNFNQLKSASDELSKLPIFGPILSSVLLMAANGRNDTANPVINSVITALNTGNLSELGKVVGETSEALLSGAGDALGSATSGIVKGLLKGLAGTDDLSGGSALDYDEDGKVIGFSNSGSDAIISFATGVNPALVSILDNLAGGSLGKDIIDKVIDIIKQLIPG